MPPLLTGTSRRGPRALKRMALAVAVRNIASITDLGDMSFADARPLLLHIENPHQLHALETHCPQLAAEPGQMADVWKRLLAKKVPDWGTRDYLGELGYGEEEDDEEEDDVFDDDDDNDDDDHAPRKRAIPWYEVYCTLKDAQDEKEAEATARLQQTLAGFTKAKETNATQLVTGWHASRALVKKMPGVGVVARRRGPGAGASAAGPSLAFGGGSRTKMTSGQSVLRRARREAREISKVSQLSTPTGRLPVGRGQIRAPPAAMLHDHRVAQQPEIVSSADVVIRAPGRRRQLSGASGSSSSTAATAAAAAATAAATAAGAKRSSIAGMGLGVGNPVREARLLALKRGGAAAMAAAASAPAPAPKEKKKEEEIRPPRAARALDDRRASTRNAKAGRRLADDGLFGDDDDLFGDDDDLFGETPAKRRRLNVDDLERTTAVSRSGSHPAKAAAAPLKKPPLAAAAGPKVAKPAPAAAKEAAEKKHKAPPAASTEAARLSQSERKPHAPAAALPSRSVLGPPRKKPVDIFMKKKKR